MRAAKRFAPALARTFPPRVACDNEVAPPVKVREQLERFFCAVGFYRPARNLYQRFLNREFFRKRQRDRDLFRQFVSTGSLVFDVGANHGHMAETYLELGARVIAIEPNPQLVQMLRLRYRSALSVEGVALGAQRGTDEFYIGRDDGHSTLSKNWLSHAPSPDRWIQSMQVRIETLDSLIKRYGTPHFIKIDVEGYEAEVLQGLTQAIRALTFEFQCSDLDVAAKCFARLAELGTYVFNATLGEETDFTGPWRKSEELLAELMELRSVEKATYGNVYALTPP